ncbi:MAG: presqualene diphosphate synthase HpnD [Rhodospirillales bacterium]|nr:presqualene diphosphate synthase HpnD [Rhodospirillales bacterium]
MNRPTGVDDADLDTVTRLVRSAGTSFYRGMRILPRERRYAMFAIYAFCRAVDDIADGAASWEEKRRALEAWRARVAAFCTGTGDDAVARVLAAAVPRYGLRQMDFTAVIDGMAMDAETPMVAPDLATLDLYCDRVAGAVGRLSVRVFGDASEAADRVAGALGRALQLTNILRDLAEDADRGRLYLPAEWLAAAHVPANPAAALASPHLPQVLARLSALAHHHFDLAERAMAQCNARAMRPARLMGTTYATLLARLERRGWQRLDESVSVPRWQKLWFALRHSLP